MIGWLIRAIGGAAGVIDDAIRRWVGALISGVFGFVHTVLGLVGSAWNDMFSASAWLWGACGRFAYECYAKFFHILRIVIPDVIRWADKFIHGVWTYAINVFHYAIREFDRLRHDIAHWLDNLRHWVVIDVWDPLFKSLLKAWHWITHEGATLWYFLTHIEKLVDRFWNALLAKIEHEAWTAGRLLGRFFISLIFHHVRQFVILLEDILNAIL
jgi:hypothetical protein